MISEKALIMNMKIAFGILLNANHIFQIKDNNDRTVTFIQKIEYSGLMSRFNNPKSYKISFDAMNVGLKNKVEK